MQHRSARSPAELRERNAAAVLAALWDEDATTASELMDATGLSRATVHDVCDQLIADGWVEELANQRAHGGYRAGRPARRYALRRDAGLVVGVHAGQTVVEALVADLRGGVLTRSAARRVHPHLDGAGRRGAVRAAALEVLQDPVVAGRGPVLCLVVGVPAPVDQHGRTVVDGNPFWQRMNPALADALGDLGQTVVVENDANLAALAEHVHGEGAPLDDCVVLLTTEGLGAGVVRDGSLVRGARGGVGEMHVLDLVSGVGDPGGLENHLADAARRHLAGAPPHASALQELERGCLTGTAVLAAAADGDAVGRAAVHDVGHRLGRIFAVLHAVHDTRHLVLAGEAAHDLAPLLEGAAQELPLWSHPPLPRLAASALGADGVGLGALARALDLVRTSAPRLGPVREPARGRASGPPGAASPARPAS